MVYSHSTADVVVESLVGEWRPGSRSDWWVCCDNRPPSSTAATECETRVSRSLWSVGPLPIPIPLHLGTPVIDHSHPLLAPFTIARLLSADCAAAVADPISRPPATIVSGHLSVSTRGRGLQKTRRPKCERIVSTRRRSELECRTGRLLGPAVMATDKRQDLLPQPWRHEGIPMTRWEEGRMRCARCR